jgi:S1-C subfamily serine protease
MRAFVCSVLAAVCFLARPVFAADDASAGYAKIKPSLVKIWALDGNGKPVESGTGFVVASDQKSSLVLTAGHVVSQAATLIVNIPGLARDITARVQTAGPLDTMLLKVDEPNLRAVRFAPRDGELHEGSAVGVAGFLKNDESIEIAGLVPRLLYPGTISSLPSNGQFIDLANLNIEEGLSGAPVFDPRSGDVFGMVDTRDSVRNQRGGYAISAPIVLSQFFDDQKVDVAYAGGSKPLPQPAPLPQTVAYQPPPPAPAPEQRAAQFPSALFQAAEPVPDSEQQPQVQQLQPAPQQWQQYQQPRMQVYQQYPAQTPQRLVSPAYGVVLVQVPRGVLVRAVAPNGIAARAGLEPGDIIRTINGQRVTTIAAAREAVMAGGPLSVAVFRMNRPALGMTAQTP